MSETAYQPPDLVARIAGFGLPGREDVPPLEVSPRQWRALRTGLFSQRLTGIAAAAVEHGSIRLTETATQELLRDHRDARIVSLILERKLLTLIPAFERAGIDVVVLKGPAIAHSFYPDPSWRSFGDIDLLVRTDDWRGALSLLPEFGFDRILPEPRPGFDERFGKGATHVDAGGFQVDLHRTLALGPFGLMLEPEELFERATVFPLENRSLRRLDDTGALVHACIHAALGSFPPRLVPLRDVAQIAWEGDVRWRLLEDLSSQWRIDGVLQHAFREVSGRLTVPMPSPAGRFLEGEIGRQERRLLAVYTSERRNRGGLSLSTLGAIPGLGRKASYLRALLFPGRPFLRARAQAGQRATYLARWRAPLRWLPSRSRPR